MKRLCSMLLVCVLILTAHGNKAAYAAANEPSSWAREKVARANGLGLVTNEMNTGLQSTATRAEFCRLAVQLIEVYYGKAVGTVLAERGLAPISFSDTADMAIQSAAALGVVSGMGGGSFSPEQALSREQAALMLRNVLNAIGIDTANSLGVFWSDGNEIADWARDAADVVYWAEIMSGVSENPLVFSPKAPYTREQAIVTMLNLWDYAGQAETKELPRISAQLPPITAPPTEVPPVAVTPTAPPVVPSRQFDMNDPNVQKHPIYATAKNTDEFKDAFRDPYTGLTRWRSAAEIIESLNNTDPDYLIDGKPAYESRMRSVQEWVDRYLAENRLTYQGKTDFEKTAIIRRIIEEGRLEEFIGLWRQNFKFTTDDCVPLAEAVHFLMTSMDFELFDVVSGWHGTTAPRAHAWNAYWDATSGAIKFLDSSFNVWNSYIDELDEKKLKLD